MSLIRDETPMDRAELKTRITNLCKIEDDGLLRKALEQLRTEVLIEIASGASDPRGLARMATITVGELEKGLSSLPA